MKLALIADIHGNRSAFDAVLAELKIESPDQVVFLGDAVTLGPEPREVIWRLQMLKGSVVMGNADRWSLAPKPHPLRDENSSRISEIEMWCAGQLAPSDLDYMRNFQPIVEIKLDDGVDLVCFHGSPALDTEGIASTMPEPELDRVLAGQQAPFIAAAHTHSPMLRRHREMTLVNPGSVGLPFERLSSGNRVRRPPWAEYALLTWHKGRLGIDLRRVSFDVDQLIRAARGSGMPHADWWMGSWRA